jgi:hypothetical protein
MRPEVLRDEPKNVRAFFPGMKRDGKEEAKERQKGSH